MKRLTTIGLALLTLLVLNAIAVASASAIEGFLPQPKTGTLEGGPTTVSTETKGGKIECKTILGEVTFDKDYHSTGTLKLSGCKLLGFPINSLGHAKEEISLGALVMVCLKAGSSQFGIALETDEPDHLEAPALGTLYVLTGLAIGSFLTAGKATKFVFDITGTEGKPTIKECFDEAGNSKKHSLTLEMNHNGKPETASLNIESGGLKLAEVEELMNA